MIIILILTFIVVPGEAAVVKVNAEKGKVAELEWQRGDRFLMILFV